MGGRLNYTKLNYLRVLEVVHRVSGVLGIAVGPDCRIIIRGNLIIHSHESGRAPRQGFNIRLNIRFRVRIGGGQITVKLTLIYKPVAVIKY